MDPRDFLANHPRLPGKLWATERPCLKETRRKSNTEFVLLPPYIDTQTDTHKRMTDRQKDRQMHICVRGHEEKYSLTGRNVFGSTDAAALPQPFPRSLPGHSEVSHLYSNLFYATRAQSNRAKPLVTEILL